LNTPHRSVTSIGLPVFAQLRISRHRGGRVTGHFNLGHDGDKPIGRVLDDLANVVLRIKPAVSLAVILFRLLARMTHEGLLSPAADLRQLGIFLDLDPPSLIIGQVPMEDVHFVQGHQVQKPLDELLRLEMSRAVEH
jgi:hypothetical protein